MASKKDMRREDLVLPYVEPEKEKDAGDMAGTMSSTLPMAAIFTRNKMIGWTAVMVAVQNYLSETPGQKSSSATPGYWGVGMALMSVGVAYMQFFMPPQAGKLGTGSGTEAPGAVPQ